MIRIKDVREDHDFTQAEIAKILGMAQTQYARYERGFNTIKIENLIKFALFFNTSLDYLCGITDTPCTLTGIDYFENRKMIIDNKKGKT